MKRLIALLQEDLKSKLGMIVLIWYVLGMFCLLLSIKRTIPMGEVRSLYVGPGNTSFFVSAAVFGILMGAAAFHFLYSEVRTDLYFGLPFTRLQLFVAGCFNNFLIFAVPLVVCRVIFFRISIAMGYCQYGESIRCAVLGCIVPVLGFLFLMGVSMLSFLLAQNMGYRLGLLALFLAGPGIGVRLAEKMLRVMAPSFYRSDILEMLKGYVSPLALFANAAGVREYADTSYWIVEEHLPYILCLIFMVIMVTALNLLVFLVRPAERGSGMFTFRWVEYVVRYSFVVFSVLWLVDGLQTFSVRGFSVGLAVVGVAFGVSVAHGLINMVLAFDARKFISAKGHLLAEFLVMMLVIGAFAVLGRQEAQKPGREEVKSVAVALTALASGVDSEQALSGMKMEGEELSAVYDWILEVCEDGSDIGDSLRDSYDVLVKFELTNGRNKYCRYQLPGHAIASFDEVYQQAAFKKGTYGILQLESVKYYETCWTNGVEQYTLDLDEEERQALWEAYCEDMGKMTFAGVRCRTPIGQLSFLSTKNQGEASGYLYPEFSKTLSLLSQYGIHAKKRICDYEITEIVADRYVLKDGLLYDVRYLAAQDTITDPEEIAQLAQDLYIEAFCVDKQLNLKEQNTEYTVYYRDSEGQTVNRVRCLKGIG